jgi:hypothetical protein
MMGMMEGASGQPKRWWPKLQVPLIGAIIVLAGGVTLVLLARRSEQKSVEWSAAISTPPPSASAPPTNPAAISPLGDLTRVDVSDLYPKIKQQAAQWSSGARLTSIAASPVVGNKVDMSAAGGEIVYQFAATPDHAGREQPRGRLALRVTREGIKPAPANERESADTDPGEPNCVSEAAAKAAHASGIPSNTPMKLRYEADRALRRGVWTAKVDGHRDLERVIDGKTCAIVTRR